MYLRQDRPQTGTSKPARPDSSRLRTAVQHVVESLQNSPPSHPKQSCATRHRALALGKKRLRSAIAFTGIARSAVRRIIRRISFIHGVVPWCINRRRAGCVRLRSQRRSPGYVRLRSQRQSPRGPGSRRTLKRDRWITC